PCSSVTRPASEAPVACPAAGRGSKSSAASPRAAAPLEILQSFLMAILLLRLVVLGVRIEIVGFLRLTSLPVARKAFSSPRAGGHAAGGGRAAAPGPGRPPPLARNPRRPPTPSAFPPASRGRCPDSTAPRGTWARSRARGRIRAKPPPGAPARPRARPGRSRP